MKERATRIFPAATLSIMMLALGGCMTRDYAVGIRNRTENMIYKAHVSYDGFQSVGGMIGAGCDSVHLSPEVPIPKIAQVEWQTEDGVFHRRNVEVKKNMPRGFKGYLMFEITDGKVVLLFEEYYEMPSGFR
ncbi:MAG: hypothetical protein ACOX5G_05540 [Kiritimatiellia bacterium]|jgi:hypothetical protein